MKQDSILYLLLHQAEQLYQRRVIYLKNRQGLHGGNGGLLFFLKQQDGLAQKELAQRMGVRPPSITAALKKLEARHYITRVQDKRDQRITRIYITDTGRHVAEQGEKIMQQVNKEAFHNITPEEKMLLRRLLLQMQENLSNKPGTDCRYSIAEGYTAKKTGKEMENDEII